MARRKEKASKSHRKNSKRHVKAIGGVYRDYFGRHFPAMTLVGVRDLYDAANGCMIEIDGVACLP